MVPVVHFYGAKELSHVLRTTQPSLLVTPDTFGSLDFGYISDLAAEMTIPWAVVAEAASPLPAGATRFERLLEAEPLSYPIAVDPEKPAIIGFTSGTTRTPKGVIHSHRSIGFEARQSAAISPGLGPPRLSGLPSGISSACSAHCWDRWFEVFRSTC